MLEKLKAFKNKSVLTFFLTAVAVILAYKVIMNIEGLVTALHSVLKQLIALLLPFIIGGLLAYLLNPAVNFFSKKVYGRFKKLAKIKTVLSLVTVYAIAAAVVVLILNMLIPLLTKSIVDIVNHIPNYFNQLMALRNTEWSHSVVGKLVFSSIDAVEKDLTGILSNYNFTAINPAITEIVGGVLSATGTALDVVFGIIISIYFILDKYKIIAGIKRISRAFLKDETADKAGFYALEAHGIFSRFIVGKTLDSLIIGILCFIGLMILRVENSALYSVIIGVTNMIPYFGPIIGAIPVVLLVLFESPLRAVWVGLFIFALQQFDGMILGPKILGDSIDLSPFWIIFAIIIGGGLFGVAGMFLGAPALAVILLAVNRLIDKKIAKKASSEVVAEESAEE